VGEIRPTFHEGTQAGYAQALEDVIRMIVSDFPDMNPMASLFSPYVGDSIVKRIEEMRGTSSGVTS
jgi:hypothetical protein